MSELNDHDNANPVTDLLSPRQRYERDLAAGVLMPDQAQAHAIAHVERLYQELGTQPERRVSFLDRILRRTNPGPDPIRGLYLWGRVGRGKTYIVDTFYDCVRDKRKLRIHFHSFMRRVHGELRQLSHESDPTFVCCASMSSTSATSPMR